MSPYNTYQGLNDAEKRFVRRHPLAAMTFRTDAANALAEAQNRFPANTLHNGRGDAFRHAYWNAIMTSHENAALAEEFATAHEQNDGQPNMERIMDLNNNRVGREIATNNPGASDARLAELVMEALNNGRLIVIQ